MWIWVIIIAIVIGAIIAYIFSGKKEEAIQGGLFGGCLATSCIIQILIAVVSIMVVFWLFHFLFG